MAAPFVSGRKHVLTWSAFKRLGDGGQWLGTWAIYPKKEPYFVQCTVAGETVEGKFQSEVSAERAAFEAGSKYLEELDSVQAS